MSPSLLRRLARDERGVAAIEYAIWASMLFFSMLGAADFGLWRAYQLRLSSAVEQAGMLAMRSPATLPTAAALRSYVQAAAALPGTQPTVTVTCNSTTAACVDSGRTYACLTNTGTYTAATGNGVACTTPANTTAGYYMRVRASYGFRPLVLPHAWLAGKSITDTLVLRIE